MFDSDIQCWTDVALSFGLAPVYAHQFGVGVVFFAYTGVCFVLLFTLWLALANFVKVRVRKNNDEV